MGKHKNNITKKEKKERNAQSIRQKEKNREEKNDRELGFIADKGSFVAGVTLLLSVIFDLVDGFKLDEKMNPRLYLFIVVIICVIIGAMMIIFQGTKKGDILMKMKGSINFSRFLTFVSPGIWILEKIIFNIGTYGYQELIAFMIIAIVLICGALYLLFFSKKKIVDKR